MFVDEQKLRSFVAVRIGSYNPVFPDDEELRTRWIGTDDIRSLFRRCIEAEFTGFHVVYGSLLSRRYPTTYRTPVIFCAGSRSKLP